MDRIGVIGDVHCEHAALEAALDYFLTANLDGRFCVGDIVDGTGDVDRCIELLRDHGVQAVAGNHDRWFLANEFRNLPDATLLMAPRSRDYLESLPRTLEFDSPAGRVQICHGIGEDDMCALYPETKGFALQEIPRLRELMARPDLKWLIGGHTHQRMVRAFPGLTVINVGTLRKPDDPCIAVIDWSAATIDFRDIEAASLRGPGTPIGLPRA